MQEVGACYGLCGCRLVHRCPCTSSGLHADSCATIALCPQVLYAPKDDGSQPEAKPYRCAPARKQCGEMLPLPVFRHLTAAATLRAVLCPSWKRCASKRCCKLELFWVCVCCSCLPTAPPPNVLFACSALDATFRTKPEILHQHRQPERRAPAVISLFFALVALAPLGGYVVVALRLGANLKASLGSGSCMLCLDAAACHAGQCWASLLVATTQTLLCSYAHIPCCPGLSDGCKLPSWLT